MAAALSLRVGIVVIGRNEGQRLVDCLRALPADLPRVYVDSGSTDNSVRDAAAAGAEVVRLDLETPFTAGRARNAGVDRLLALHPTIEAIQFLDGDTIMDANWLSVATAALAAEPSLAVVAGRRRERFPSASWYNELCDIEWNTPVGDARAVGGDALYRAGAFSAVGGFDPSVIAGEEPELCFRLRARRYGVRRLGVEMTLHDAAIHTFGPWWRRCVRSGYAYALGATMHGRTPEQFNVRETMRAAIWGGALPAIGVLAFLMGGIALFLLIGLVYLAKWYRLGRRHEGKVRDPQRYAAFLMLANVAEAWGVLRCMLDTAQRRQRQIIEYK